MAERERFLPEFPEWLEFCRRYQGDIVKFQREVCRSNPSNQQKRVLRSAAKSRARTSVASGHGTGKTKELAVIVLWHLTCFPLSVGLVTANDMDQLKATLWKEVAVTLEDIRRGPFAWVANQIFQGMDGHVHVMGFQQQWFFESKTANSKTANKMAGRHGKYFLVLADEASTIPDEVFTTLTGALTEQHNRMVLTSQYTRDAGFFHRTQTELSHEQGGDWDAITLSSIDSPFVSDEWIKEKIQEYDDDEIRVRLLGLSPGESSKRMMSAAHAHGMYVKGGKRRGRIIGDHEPWGWLVLGDVALGEGLRDKSTLGLARVCGYGDTGPDARRVEIVRIPINTNNIRANQYANYAHEEGAELNNPTYVVDAGGLGGVVCQDLEDKSVVVHRVIWANPCFQKKNRERYINLRAQAMHFAARAAKDGRLVILTDDHKKTMLGQSSRIPKAFGNKDRIQVPPKGSKEWDGLGSPDLWDMVCFAFLEDVEYMVADSRTMGVSTSVVEQVEALFADLA